MKRLYIVGIGPGDGRYLTEECRTALEQAEVLCGYTGYLAQIAPLYPEKAAYGTGMKQEAARCRWALETAQSGRSVALICSGDTGVYGMAGPTLQLAPQYPEVEIAVIPGITAALSGAAVLGAPLGHDFCVISLSDLLTPWACIARRLRAAAEGDFVICLYNPGSGRRRDHLRRACEILLEGGKAPDTVCGWVRNIGRGDQAHQLLTLRELQETAADMFTTVFIGASATEQAAGRMVTPRGYTELCRQ